MLPWFCGFQKDLQTLEVAEGGTNTSSWSGINTVSIPHLAKMIILINYYTARLEASELPNQETRWYWQRYYQHQHHKHQHQILVSIPRVLAIAIASRGT
jgi:hypothetical protein